MRVSKSLSLLAGLALGLLPATSRADTFRVTGQELTGETITVDGDGSVRTVVSAGLSGFVYHAEMNEQVFAHAMVTMAITVNGDELRGAELTYRDLTRAGFTVTIQIDPCWFEYVNERDATAARFGDDVVARIEAAAPRAIDPCWKHWFADRLAQLGARTAEQYVKAGVTLVPPRR
jgi:hypothetical protein